jgi:hypothetical protein
MRIATLTLLGAIGLAASSVPARAAPTGPVPVIPQASNAVQVAGVCGWAFHRNRWGQCVPNRRGYHRPYRYWQPYWPGYYGDGHEPWNRPSPSDHVANRLNRQVLRGRY